MIHFLYYFSIYFPFKVCPSFSFFKIAYFYKNSTFIKILKLNSPLGSGNVLNTNNCEISICDTKISNKVVILCAIDNLVKGAAGQAIQNMNLLYKFPESLGLK